MSRRVAMPSQAAVARVRELAERRLSPEEFAARLAAPLGDDERAAMRQLIEWFRRRYPTPHQRLRSGRRLWSEWARNMPR
jgi:DNA-binding GntR family transcriptional regulator